MVASTIRKIHVPAYCPVLVGVQALEKRDVVVDVKKVDIIDGISVIVEFEDDMSMIARSSIM